jgi:hypothetical protein
MLAVKLKVVAALLLAVGLLAAGLGAVAWAPAPPQPQARSPQAVDWYGDALPPGAVARLGTVRLRHGIATQAVAYSPDGTVVASAGRDRGV